jgi:hypothetical protein
VGTALHYLMTQKDQGLADRFCEQLGKGEHLETKDAAWQLRNKFLGDKQPLHHKTVAERAALLVLAFNCQRRRLPFDVSMKWKGLSNSQIPFPQIV